jgi:hypothetical protein
MFAVTAEEVVRLVNHFVTRPGGAVARSLDDRLADLGIDSLTSINILLAAADQFELDLSRLDTSVPIPLAIGDLINLMHSLQT